MRLPERNVIANAQMRVKLALHKGVPLGLTDLAALDAELELVAPFYEAWIGGWRGHWHEYKAEPAIWTCPACKKPWPKPNLGICQPCKAEETAR